MLKMPLQKKPKRQETKQLDLLLKTELKWLRIKLKKIKKSTQLARL